MNKILTFSIMSILFVGCGGGGSSDTDPSAGSSDTQMVIATPYTVYPGNAITKNSENAKLKIIHIDGERTSTVELIEGNATLSH